MPGAVLDSSAAVHMVLRTPYARSLTEFMEEAQVAAAPDVFFTETTNGLWKYVRHRVLSLKEASMRLLRAIDLVEEVVPCSELALEALAAGAQTNHSVYDLMYATLARRLDATVLTMDGSFAQLLQRMEIPVFCPLLKDSQPPPATPPSP